MKRTKIAVGLLTVAALAACATKTQTGAAAGTGIGAAVGAGVGYVMGGGKGAAVGAAVGGAGGLATGALIGHYMDKQEADLKKVKSAKVERQGDKLQVHFNSAILFDVDKHALKPAAEHDLAELAGVLVQYPDTELVVTGHTDNTGKKEHNRKLSVSRAEAVAHFLESKSVAASRLTAQGRGDEEPVADNGTDAGRQQNRRVQIEIKANEKLKQQDAAAAQGQGGQPAGRPANAHH